VRIANIALLAITAVFTSFLHHGHIEMFISDVRRAFSHGARSNGRVEQASSRLSVASLAPGMRYEVAVRRKTRAVETSLHLEAAPAEVDQWLALLAEHADEIRAQLGSGVEPERLTRTSARLHHTQIITAHDDAWSPKRDLTPDLVDEIAARLARFMEVLEPIVD
jgi:hypothetical protein